MLKYYNMKCRKCGFVFKGNSQTCPHCGEPLENELRYLDRQFNFFNWFYISNRSLITIMSLNVYLLFFVIEIVLNSSGQISTHIYPWVFAGLFLVEHIAFNLSDPKNNFPYMFVIGGLFSLFLFLSYQSQPIFDRFTYAQFIFGLSTPIFLLTSVLLCPIHYMRFRTFNTLNVFFNALSVLLMASLMYGLSYIPAFGFEALPLLRMFTNVIYIVTVFFSLQLFMFCFFRLRSSYNREIK